jgi:DNA topoisomerase II
MYHRIQVGMDTRRCTKLCHQRITSIRLRQQYFYHQCYRHVVTSTCTKQVCNVRLLPLKSTCVVGIKRPITTEIGVIARRCQFDLYFRLLSTRSSSVLRQQDEELTDEIADTSVAVVDDDIRSTMTVEEQYSRKTPVEHVLLRPGMYVGPNERLPPTTCWVLDQLPSPPSSNESISVSTGAKKDQSDISEPVKPKMRFVQKEYGIVPALIKVFDEILVNASDNRLRHPKSCNRIDVVIDPGSTTGIISNRKGPYIRVYNNGKGIPIHIHATEQMYVPELVFGHLLTGSNFNDDEKRITGGRHGYGAKLANIFSKSFTVETVDKKERLQYQQTWTNNMTNAARPIITQIPKKQKGIEDYTSVEFEPDLVRLTGDPNCTAIPNEDYAIMCRRVIDVAGCGANTLHVTLNGTDVSFTSFLDYCQLYRNDKALPICFNKMNPRWTISVGLSESGSLEAISFVNGMATTRGGTHVNVLINQITKYLLEVLEKNNSDLAELISPSLIRRNLFICVDTQIENATFDSQMKEYLTSSPDTFGSSYTIGNTFLKKLVQSEEDGGPGIIEKLINVAQGQRQANLMKNVGGKKTRRQLLAIPKLEDAHRAGRNDETDCTLILTEGDSAKSLAVAGLEVLGRNYFGVFPLRGKLLNVRDVPMTKLVDNNEIKALLAIIGLSFDRDYETMEERRDLRYQRVMIMTDQDTGALVYIWIDFALFNLHLTFSVVFKDGSHIKGLVINFFRCFWPKLLLPPVDKPPEISRNYPPFLAAFVTPLLKATKKGKKKNETMAFYSMAEYNSWRSELEPSALKGWTIKYYKGLGTSTPTEAKEYFSAFVNNLRPFRWKSDSDGDMLDMVFDKKRAADRRDWILDKYDVEASIVTDPAEGNSISFEDFVNKEMIHFSHADNIRSIPSAIDGLKPSQRKVLYACFKRNLKSEIKVAQLSGYW